MSIVVLCFELSACNMFTLFYGTEAVKKQRRERVDRGRVNTIVVNQ